MTPRRLEALRAMAAQTKSPHEQQIAAKALERHYAKHPEDRPGATVGRKTVPVYPAATNSASTSTGWPTFSYDDLMNVAFSAPRADPADIRRAGPCPVCKHKHARTGTWCASCAIQGIADDCSAYFGPGGWATFDKGPLA